MGKTTIEWTRGDDGSPGHTVNPIRARLNDAIGHYCEKVSAGCVNCYASRMQPRFGMPPFQQQRHLDVEPFFDATRLDEVLRRKKPTRWFWCDMTDLFGAWVPDAWIDQCFAVMALTPQHTHQLLTKRPERMREYVNSWSGLSGQQRSLRLRDVMYRGHPAEALIQRSAPAHVGDLAWPLPNVWAGVSCEDQPTADARIPILLQTPAAVRFVSAEPLLGPITLNPWLLSEHGRRLIGAQPGLDWLIVGGESGLKARPCDVAWIRRIVEQCRAAGVPAFVKQLGSNVRDRNDAGWDATSHVWADGADAGHPVEAHAWPDHIRGVAHNPNGWREEYQGAPVRVLLHDRKGGDFSEWPADLRVREFPTEAR